MLSDRTCTTCLHFEPDTHRCTGGVRRLATDDKGKERELLPVVGPGWTCPEWELYEGEREAAGG